MRAVLFDSPISQGDAVPAADALEVGDARSVPRDARAASEACNGIDDDGDFRIDESPTSCWEAPGGHEAVCLEGGVCVCRHPALLARAGSFADCNDRWADGCETELGTTSNCGSCGEVCQDLVEECTETVEGGLRCRPVGILDFSVSRDDGDITCIVREDHQVICRGPNTAYAISDLEEETATLDWTVVGFLDAVSVHASSRVRADGTEVLSICIVTTEGRVTCRGDNGTGILGFGDDRPRSGGYHFIDLPGNAVSMLNWGGDAYALLEATPPPRFPPEPPLRFALHRWGGAGRNRAPEHLLDEVFSLSIGDMPAAVAYHPTTPTIYMWGPHRSGLSQVPEDTPEWETPQTLPFRHWWTACFRDLCCGLTQARFGDRFTFAISCWGRGPTSAADGSRFGSALAPTSIEVGGETYQLRSSGFGSQVADRMLMAPDGEGGIRVCDRYFYSTMPDPDPPRRLAPTYPVMVCGEAGQIDAAARGEGVIAIFPGMTTETQWPSTRVDWQAICLDHAPNDWQCWGAHDGWGHPPIP